MLVRAAGRASLPSPLGASSFARTLRAGQVRRLASSPAAGGASSKSGSRWAWRAFWAAAVGLPTAKVGFALSPLWSEDQARELPARGVQTFDNTSGSGSSIDLEGMRLGAWFLASEASDRLIRDAFTAAAMVSIYVAESRKAEPDWSAAHDRAAHRLLVLCAANRGVYIKLGQHVAMLEHLLPTEYVRALEPLCHTAPRSRYEDVRAVIREELGAEVEAVFSDFEPEPIASASLAQVHRATLRATGERVAVKVQHRGLREASAVDLRTIAAIVDAVKQRFPRFEYTWLVNEIRDNLPKELDFSLEAGNIEASGAFLAASGLADDVAVPRVHRAATATRVLTMSFEEGCYVTNVGRIRGMGVDPAWVSATLSRAFNDQIFRHGFVHCDPHAGNVLVRPHPDGPAGRGQLVLLDHGLYRTLRPGFQASYARLWTSIIFADEAGIRAAATDMGVGDRYHLLASVLTTKPWDDVIDPSMASLQVSRTAEGRQQTGDYAKQYVHEINDILGRVPRELLLLLKTLDCLRSIDAALGAPVDSFETTARACLRRTQEDRAATSPGWATAAANWGDWLGLESRFAAMHAAAWWYGTGALGPAASDRGVTMVGQAGGADGGTGVDEPPAARL